VEHEGTPAGKIETIGGVRSYVATPSGEYAKEKVLLLLTDVFGLELVNGQASALVTTSRVALSRTHLGSSSRMALRQTGSRYVSTQRCVTLVEQTRASDSHARLPAW
jgi:hypothetical protein